ncbi:Sodium bicarbonate transporter-like protein 11 [Galdieria sulphuraria]|nr:Sodium bicarbonate transporter-like protein 11 [Galdieria sulphuraria]
MSSYQPSISEADLSVFERNTEDTFECVIHPVTLLDVSEDLHGFSILESFAKDRKSVIKTRFRGEDSEEIILKLLQLLERRNLVTEEARKEARSKLLGAENSSLVEQGAFSWDASCGKTLGYWTHSVQGPSFIVGYASLDNIQAL